MAKIIVRGNAYLIDLVVFDKDGLMFQSQAFWKVMAEARTELLNQTLPANVVQRWLKIFGVQPSFVDPTGVFATASPKEEIAITAGIIIDELGLTWTDARALALRIFNDADIILHQNLRKALVPRKGFPDIFTRLIQNGIPYAVATSDTRDRVNESLTMFDVPLPAPDMIITPEDVSRGKPFPDMLEVASKRTGIPVNKMMVIGDSFVDMKMAKDAGAIGIGIPETDSMYKKMFPYAGVIIDSLDEIKI